MFQSKVSDYNNSNILLAHLQKEKEILQQGQDKDFAVVQ